MKNIAIGCDHAGFILKEHLKNLLSDEGYTVNDFGTDSETSVDYPDYIHPLAHSIEKGKNEFGIIICGSGNGVNMTANKHNDIRSALCWTAEIAHLARQHNNANVIALPARFMSVKEAEKAINEFLNTPFEGGRHATRVAKITI